MENKGALKTIAKEYENIGGKIGLIERMQEELYHRTDVEERAVQLICEGKHEAAIELLNSLDDSVITRILENTDYQRPESEKETTT